MRWFAVLLAGLGFWSLAPAAKAQETAKLALLIGNQGYEPSVGVLKNPHNDIALVGAALSVQGFTVLPLVKDASRVEILRAIRDFARRLNQAGAGAIGFFYYSGHGAAENGTNANYLIPIGAGKPGSEGFWDESVNLDDVLKLLSNASAAAKFVLFDACRNELRLPYRGSKGFVPVREQPGIFVAYTTAPGQPASDDGKSSGPYAAALAAELAKPGLDHLSLFQNVKEAVYAATNGAQQPWESNGLLKRIYLTGRPQASQAGAPPVTPRPQAPVSEAALSWDRIKDSKNPAVFKKFREQFGKANPVYDVLAADKEAELVRAAGAAQSSSGSSWWPWSLGGNQEAQPKSALNVPNAPRVERAEGCDGLAVSVAAGKSPCIKPGSGESFRDCPDCPEMVIVPSGSFSMGSPPVEEGHSSSEDPRHLVRIQAPLAVGKFAVTFAEWDTCAAAGGCGGYKPSDEGWGRGDRPVVNVSWNDADMYAAWLAKKTGHVYRLLSEAEREYSTRAGTPAPFWFGTAITPENANYNTNFAYGGPRGEYRRKTVPVNSFLPNPWGLYQVHGNVWEWTEDCWHENYQDAPANGSAWTDADCLYRVIRGGGWSFNPRFLRAAARSDDSAANRNSVTGFRVARKISR